MNSYPPELLAQLAPVMFVAGLDLPKAPAAASGDAPSPPPKVQDPFSVLTIRLREALSNQRKVAIWQPDKSRTFQVILVDREIRFPPRKLASPEDPQYASTHSPLSPLTPTSPLYPDGLIAPIWIRKHTTLVPSVFVLFTRLYEAPSTFDANQTYEEERARDIELAYDLSNRKRLTNERGIKMTVVLIASRRMLDDPALDARLTFLRKQSNLDSRAALFVLSPVSLSELTEFVKSLQQALYEPAVEYYTNHSKRVRRKRNRHSQAISSYQSTMAPIGSPNLGRPLRPEGWTVRYEYKMACFAEFRGEDEVALKHYQDAYETLAIMFGSTAILPPRTKRWAEAKVLADCIDIKITKLYLYNNEHALALSHHSTHIRKFSDFSRGWGIGEETYEFWSWVARQHRILAELLEHGTRSNLAIPSLHPIVTAAVINSPPPIQSSLGSRSSLEVESIRSLGLNPGQALQHPGFYYYMAAKGTELRRERFLASVQHEESQQAPSPSFANEKKVDHLGIILDLYTKAYELFKKYANDQAQGRHTLWIAYRIAQTHYASEKYDMAMKFLERIAKTYRRDKWGSLMIPLLSTWYTCSQRGEDIELSLRLLIELISHDQAIEQVDLQQDFVTLLKTREPPSDLAERGLIIDLSEVEPLFETNTVFWKPDIKVGETGVFQLSLKAPSLVLLDKLPVASVRVDFSYEQLPSIVLVHSKENPTTPSLPVRLVNIGQITHGGENVQHSTNLRWNADDLLIVAGIISIDMPSTVQIERVTFFIEAGVWKIEVPHLPCCNRQGSALSSQWLSSIDPMRFLPIIRENHSSLTIRHKKHHVSLSVTHQSPAYVDEDYTVLLSVTNNDDKELEFMLDILLQPFEGEAENTIAMDDEKSSSLLKGIFCGSLAPGDNLVKTLLLSSRGSLGDRILDISVQSQAHEDVSELLQTVTVPTIHPFECSFDIEYRKTTTRMTALSDLRSFEGDFWDDADGGEAVVTATMRCIGPSRVEVERVVFEEEENEEARFMDTSIDGLSHVASDYFPGDEFCETCRISLASIDDRDLISLPISGPGKVHVYWTRLSDKGERGSSSKTTYPLPALSPPQEPIVALLNAPPTAKLHEPTTLRLKVRNRHSSRSANITVHLEQDTTDGFILAGLSSGRIPILLPGSEHEVSWRIIPIDTGYVKMPKIRVMDRRKKAAGTASAEDADIMENDGDEILVTDARVDYATLLHNAEMNLQLQTDIMLPDYLGGVDAV